MTPLPSHRASEAQASGLTTQKASFRAVSRATSHPDAPSRATPPPPNSPLHRTEVAYKKGKS